MYINIHPIHDKVHCGEVNFPFGTRFGVDSEGFIFTMEDGVKKQVCLESSERAYRDFAWNDDDHGEERKDLINDIKDTMAKVDKAVGFEALYTDPIALKYKKHKNDMTEWSWDRAKVHKAPLEDLYYLQILVNGMPRIISR